MPAGLYLPFGYALEDRDSRLVFPVNDEQILIWQV